MSYNNIGECDNVCLHFTTNVIYNPDNIIEKKITQPMPSVIWSRTFGSVRQTMVLSDKFTVFKIKDHCVIHCACMGSIHYNRAN